MTPAMMGVMTPEPEEDDGYEALPCVVCTRPLKAISDDEQAIVQPQEAVMFTGRGNYGSAVWDPINYDFLIVNICDGCIRAASEKYAVKAVEPRPQPTAYILSYFKPDEGHNA